MSREDIPASREAEEQADENKEEVNEEELPATGVPGPTNEGRREEGTVTLGVAEGLSGSCTIGESATSQEVENSSRGYTNTRCDEKCVNTRCTGTCS